jgi:hypothetical protein
LVAADVAAAKVAVAAVAAVTVFLNLIYFDLLSNGLLFVIFFCFLKNFLKLMENSESADKKDKQVLKNGADLDILCRDEAFWQQTVKNLAEVENVTVNK